MSRSYKKHLYAGDKQNKKDKQIANRKFRHNVNYNEDSICNKGNIYKKTFESWDIRDYGSIAQNFEEFYNHQIFIWEHWGQYINKPYPSKKEAKKLYDKLFKRK